MEVKELQKAIEKFTEAINSDVSIDHNIKLVSAKELEILIRIKSNAKGFCRYCNGLLKQTEDKDYKFKCTSCGQEFDEWGDTREAIKHFERMVENDEKNTNK